MADSNVEIARENIFTVRTLDVTTDYHVWLICKVKMCQGENFLVLAKPVVCILLLGVLCNCRGPYTILTWQSHY